ncbi:MAG: phosphate acyltransferase, partial [Rhodocyclaceae bacterium]|nr:phosphate acyltransferase [Rhodocyclaceae bacterium]
MTITLAVDCMGGDHGPSVIVPAVLEFLHQDRDCSAILVGREEAISPFLTQVETALKGRWSVHHASEVVDMDEP